MRALIQRRSLHLVAAAWLAVAVAVLGSCTKGGTTFDDDAPTGGTEAYQSTCGNGVIDPTEECDGEFLHQESCETLGMGSGMLACDPITCSYDTSMCQGPTGGGGGDGSSGGAGG